MTAQGRQQLRGARATLCVEVDCAQEKERAARWFDDNKDELTYVSANRGCGCCVDLFDVEGSAEAIDRLPQELRSGSEWASGRGERPQGGKAENPYRSLLRKMAKEERRVQGRSRRR